ncbi:MAG: acetate--CoA ligase family protein [Comamonadaceae bacterium]|nr:acetate--CoA ligase family protein [Comamonadaceae bacterium]
MRGAAGARRRSRGADRRRACARIDRRTCWPPAARWLDRARGQGRCSPPAASRWWPRAASAADAGRGGRRGAARIGYPVALKILSPRHQRTRAMSAACALDLRRRGAVREAAAAMLRARARALRPDAALEGFTVQAMVRRAARAGADRRRQHRPRCSAR